MNGDNRAQAVASGGGAMPQPGSDEWLKVASREELVQLIRILQLKLTQKTSKPKPPPPSSPPGTSVAAPAAPAAAAPIPASVAGKQGPPSPSPKPRPKTNSHTSLTSSRSGASSASAASSSATPAAPEAPASQRAVATLVRLRSLGSLDDLTGGNLMAPDADTMVEGMRSGSQRGPVLVPRRSKKREGSLRSRSGSISTGRTFELDARGENYELSSDLQTRLDTQAFASKKYTQEHIDACITIQRRWREFMLRQRFNMVKKRAMRRSVQKRLDLICTGTAGMREDVERRRQQLMQMQSGTPSAAASSPVGMSSGLGGSYPWMPEDCPATSEQERQRLHRIAVYQFNRNVKKGLEWILKNKAVVDDPGSIALFLRAERTLNRYCIGEFLGERDTSFHMAVLNGYIDLFEFKGLEFDRALRMFLASFRLPGEAQKIERILEVFARKYYDCNPGVFAHPDTPFILSFSIVMLHTDIHNDANKRKMCQEDFVRNNRGIDDGEDLPREYLEQIYNRIAEEEFKTQGDNMSMIENIVGQMTGKTTLDLAAPHRQFLSRCSVITLETFQKSKGKQTSKSRVLFLFNDLLLVAKQHAKGKFHPKQVIPLLGLGLSQQTTEHFANAIQLINKFDHGEVLLRFFIENLETSTMAKNFVNDLREMIWQCEAIEGVRFNKLDLAGPTEEDCDESGMPRSLLLLREGDDNASVASSDSGHSAISSNSNHSSRSRSRSVTKRFGLSLRKKTKKEAPRAQSLFDGHDGSEA